MNMLSGALPPPDFFVTQLQGCELGFARMPSAALAAMPFDAFVLADSTHYTMGHALFTPYPRVVSYQLPTDPSIGSTFAAVGREGHPSLIKVNADYVANDGKDPTDVVVFSMLASLKIACLLGFESIAFTVPRGRTEDDLPSPLRERASLVSMIGGLQLFLGTTDGCRLRQILIRVAETDSLNLARACFSPDDWPFVREIGDEGEDTFSGEVKTWIARKTSPEAPPRLIMSLDEFMDTFKPVSPDGQPSRIVSRLSSSASPEPGYVRPYSNSILDRALAMMPELMSTTEDGNIPPYIFERRMHHSSERSTETLFHYALIQESATLLTRPGSDVHPILGEIYLTDVPQPKPTTSRDIAQVIVVPQIPHLLAEMIFKHSGTTLMPDDVYLKILTGMDLFRLDAFDAEDMDRILVFGVLHECAEIFWYSLPDEMQAQWRQLHQMDVDPINDFTHYKNLLRTYIECRGEPGDRGDFLARETFADKLALSWNTDVPHIFTRMGWNITPRERNFLEQAMSLAAERRRRYGRALVKI